MNIYLDIDGVLLINETSASPYANEFLKAIMAKYPHTTFWLTTHCWRGENRTAEILSPLLDEYSKNLLLSIQPTEWGDAKTDAIDFSQPFLWFDDDLYHEERLKLEENDALANWVEVNLSKNENQLKDLIRII